ncbi:MAG: ABC transporter permease [Pegethrix bostrychoides GSE-TBD4-15B]|jgi:ABC-type transport system involved in multi-copper enzyme maturation permease subunit|uniref:ABC transporter permease n=1 Tax=Pegethrix bostrychoides GSE-TBD4-15B TaxID=2839662 RepID=A0A951PD34_9CYAN|nr:ABC transporter permease [Pegethrix bostrychoides GSE-TBD4-15B]
MNLARTSVIASNLFREVIRDRVLYLLLLYGLIMAAASQLLPRIAANTQDKILLDLGIAAIGILALLIAVFVGTGLVQKEIEKRTVLVMIAKPISAAEFIVGKHWGLTGVLALLVTVMTAMFWGLLQFQQIPFPMLSLGIAALFQILELALITAVAILLGVLTSPILAMLLSLAVYLMGHLSRDLLALGKLVPDATFQQVTKILYLILPDLSRLDWKNQAVYGMNLMPAPLELAGHAAYGLLYTSLLLAIATFIFSRRQF